MLETTILPWTEDSLIFTGHDWNLYAKQLKPQRSKEEVMSTLIGGPAFLSSSHCAKCGCSGHPSEGITVLDYFAAAALQSNKISHTMSNEGVAEYCYSIAQEMMIARNRHIESDKQLG